MWRMAMVACCALALPALAQAQSREDASDQRYVFHEVDEGILRLDAKLGEVSLCSRQTVGWTCRTVPDERNALDTELARLQQENAELKNALAAHNERNGQALRGEPSTPEQKVEAPSKAPDATPSVEPKAESKGESKAEQKPEPKAKSSSGGDLERVRVVVGVIWRRLVEMMAALRADLQQDG